jgi:hypothetical protein
VTRVHARLTLNKKRASQMVSVRIYDPFHMRNRMIKVVFSFCVLVCCIVCLDEQIIISLTTPRMTLAFIVVVWLRCEWCMWQRRMKDVRWKWDTVKENYELVQTVNNLSEQHRLLCEIRNNGLKSLRYVKDTFAEVRFPSAYKRSFTSSQSASPSVSTPESKPEDPPRISPLVKTKSADSVQKSKAAFRRGSMSESNVSCGSLKINGC